MISRRSVLQLGGALAVAGSVGAAAPSAQGARSATVPWDQLRARLRGDLVLPADSGYDLAKQLAVAEYDAIHPQGIAYCETPADVASAVRFAQANSLPTRTRSGGHNFAGWSTGEGLVVDVSRIKHVKVGASTVRLGPGAMSVEALTALKPYNRQIVTGTCPTVCPGGFLTGGGIGFQTARYGLGSDRLVSARAVLADGSLVTASATREPDLFWALRGGGGGNFGVLVDFEVLPIDQPRGVYFATTWPWDKARELVEAWQQWSLADADTLGSSCGVLLFDAAPGTTPMVTVNGGYWGAQADLEAGLDALAAQAGAQPLSRSVAELPYDEVMMHVYGCDQVTVKQCHRVGQNDEATIPRGGALRERHRLFDKPLTGSALAATLAAFDADRHAGHTRFLGFNHLGGASTRPGRTDTAFWHRDTQFLIGIGAALPSPTPSAEDEAVTKAWVDRGYGIIDPLSTGHSYINFPDERLEDWQQAYYGGNYDRLVQVKNAYDPGNFFNHPQSIGS
ncbi:FAD-binding oxidoreductase [Streptomyces hokutonensis]|uniref:FAD-binding oxidoreductase n=1 Tax=Streptomyces hokutonensis TaxID=1306990 RepID=UPI0003A48F29|nr:FAD-binding protein [Streptomyces hokutonensis]